MLSLTFANILGWVVSHWKVAVVVAITIVVGCVLLFSRCGHTTPKLNEKQIAEAQKAIADGDRAKQEKVLVESIVAEEQIDANVANAKAETVNAIVDAKNRVKQMDDKSLVDELNRRAQ